MSTSNFSRMAGLGGILAGAFWLFYVIADFSFNSVRVFNGEAWDFLAVLAAALILVLTLALYRQGDQPVNGLLILGIGSAMLTLSVFFYAIELDPEDGAAFMVFFFGTIIQGLGIAIVGNSYRTRNAPAGWGTVLLVLSTILALTFPVSLFIGSIVIGGQTMPEQVGDIIWFSVMVLQAVTWMILGAKVLTGRSATVDTSQQQTA